LVLINNFVSNTAGFLNTFSETVEKKISNISNRITELEILISFMEAKLHSIPGLEDRKEEPLSSPTVGTQSEPVKETLGVKASEHPDYIQFFKLLKLGVPISVVQAKVVAANLDPSIIDQPDLVL
jgi:WASH complex subunit CCDC53